MSKVIEMMVLERNGAYKMVEADNLEGIAEILNGGLRKVVKLPKQGNGDVAMVFDAEGENKGLPVKVSWEGGIAHGTIIFTGYDNKTGNLVSLEEHQEDHVNDWLAGRERFN